MESFSQNISFKYPWRSYQREVLEHLDEHLSNQHLHLVAPPGSGKTVLGLEVMLQLNKPTLIVAPTLAIRNQWVDRFMALFLNVKEQPAWISTDVRNPQFITVTTYQGLHALFDDSKTEEMPEGEALDDEEKEEIPELTDRKKAQNDFIKCQFETIILDEAHHLRTSWWRTTMTVRDRLTNPTTVALTATPPYDVDKLEWDRYIELCGPIDEEIEVAALVKEGDLCPHQDYVWMSMPTKKEREPIETFHDEAKQLKAYLLHNLDFQALIENHPWIQSGEHVEEKLAQHAYFISMIIYLKEVGSDAWEKPFQLIDEKPERLPAFDLEWTEELLSGLLYRDEWTDPKDEPLKSIRQKLSAMSALERRRVKLIATKSMERTLLHSASKLDSVHQIVTLEKNAKDDDLRLVILADYIYADDLPKHEQDPRTLVRLGVVPIFEHLRRKLENHNKLGVLTGSIVIVPKEVVPFLKKYQLTFTAEPLIHDDRYRKITWQGTSRQGMVRVITEAFSEGKIDVLVGTTALLGEGWDAPSVNTLILASYVGSFMLTNQMRGRAIRVEKGNPHKAANIWHLVCVDRQAPDGGHDVESLRRRFRSLTGLDEELPLIVSGIERLRIPQNDFNTLTIESINHTMTARANDRRRLFARWKEAVQQGEKKREELHVDSSDVPRPFVLRNTLKTLLVVCIVIVFNVIRSIGQHTYAVLDWRQLLVQVIIGFLIGIIISAPIWWKIMKIVLFNISIESSMKQVAEAVYHTLYNIELIETPPAHNKIHVTCDEWGEVHCYSEKGTKYEQKLFLQSLQQLVDPIDNPRYILHRKSGKHFWVRHDYHAVPEEIGRKKEYAETFLAQWNRKIGKAELIFTRSPEGRKMLLKARTKAMSAQFVKRSERISVWK